MSSSTPTPTVAQTAASFDDSIGVNVHMAYTWTTYADVGLVESSLAYLGVDNVRDDLANSTYLNIASDEQLAAAGIKFDFVLPVYSPSTVNLSQFVSMVDTFATSYPGSVVAIEGANEVNLWPATYNGGTTLADEAALQQALYAAVRSDPNLNGIPVYNLTMAYTDPTQYEALGNLSSAANDANSHAYLNDSQTPEFSMSVILPFAMIDAPGLPEVITETGYETNPADTYGGADQTVQAKLTLDELMDAFKAGVSETYLYELFDEGGSDYGLFNADGTPKLVATAIYNLTTLLADPGSTSSFTPGSLSYAVTGLPVTTSSSYGNQFLLEKSTGTFDLALWAEAPIWNPTTETEIVAPSETATVSFGQTQNVVLIFDPLQGATPIAAYLNTKAVQVSLTDDPLIVEIPTTTSTLLTPTITTYSPESGGTGDGLILTGAAVANGTVLVFDNGTEVGTATANASGVWTFATGSLAGGTNSFTGMAVDASGDVSALSAALKVNISAAPSAASVTVPIIFDYSITSTNQVVLTGTAEANTTVSIFNGTSLLGTATASASGAWTYTSNSWANGDYTFVATATDGAGNVSGSSNAIDAVISQPPIVLAVAASAQGITNGNGDLGTGAVATLTLTMSEAVTVSGGTPTLTLNDGGTATYTGGSGTGVLTFSYAVGAADKTSDLAVTALNANGASIYDAAGNGFIGTVPNLSGALQINIPTTAPTVSSLVASGTGISNGTGDLDAGKSVTFTVNLSEAVTVAGGTPTLTLNDGGTATYSGGSGSSALTFSYTVAAGQNTPDLAVTAVNLNAATVTDGAGNAANLSGAVAAPAGTLQIDTTAPTVSSLVASGTGINSGTGNLDAGKTVTLTLNLSEAVTVAGGTPTLTLNDGGTATYSGGSGSSALTFSYTVAAGQNTPDLAVTAVNLNAATVTDGAGNTANLSGAVAAPAGTLQIDTTAPAAPVISTDTINANSTVSLSGTAEANSKVTVYDGQTALGTTVASSTGAWSYTTATLSNGAQTFTAAATDAAGNTSVASNAVDPNIGASTELIGAQAGTLSIANGTTLDITGTVDNTGTVSLNATANTADLAVVGAATLTGAGKVTLSNNAGNVITSNGAAATLTNVNNTISGAGAIGDSHLTLNNQGTINANDALALVINTGSNTITNSGTLEATSSGGLNIDSNVNNSKTIEALGTNAKVVIESTVTNTTTGLVLASGSSAQVDLDNATISGGKLQTSGSNAVIETVSGSTDALDGGNISSGSTVEINANSALVLNGTVGNSGTLLVNGTLDVDGALAGGTTEISGAGRVVVAQSSGENVSFLAKDTGQLVLNQATSYKGTISGFGTTQSIDLTDIDFAAGVKVSYASNGRRNTSGVLTITEGTQTVRLELDGTYTLANFKVASDGDGGTLLTDPTVVTQGPGNASATIGNNTVLEVSAPDKGNVTFSGTTGTLWLDQPATFTGKVSGFGAQNVIDLPGIAFGPQTTLGYSANSNNSGGTLSLATGANTANIALLGSYMASSFAMESDNHGGTMVISEASQTANHSVLASPSHG